MNMVRYKQGELPPLSEERKAELKKLAEMPESEIDYSDIPPLDENFWARAVPNPFSVRNKSMTIAEECQ